MDATTLVKTLRTQGTAEIATWSIELEDLVITEVPRTGWMVASHEAESVALDLTLTPELIAAGNVREVIRFIQEARKTNGFDISDRIRISWNAPDEIASAVEAAQDHISAEVLATEFTRNVGIATLEGELGFNATLLKS
jgi:isoleucyl-tRNA synthetase